MKQLILPLFLFFFCSLCCKKDISQSDKIEAQFKKEQGILIDVRTPDEWNAGHHANAILSDWNSGQFKEQSIDWDPSKSYFMYCRAGRRSGDATEYLKSKGFNKVYNIGAYDSIKHLKLESQ